MNRRQLFATVAAAPLAAAATKYTYHLRYAPRIGMVQEPIERQFEIIAENGFTAFEYNGLPKHTMAEIEGFRKKMDALKLSMGTLVVNRGGWKPSAMVDPQFHPDFLADVVGVAAALGIGRLIRAKVEQPDRRMSETVN